MTAHLPITPLDSWIAGKIGIKRLTSKSLAAFQLSQLKETIARAQNLSPFYRQHLANFREICFKSLENLADYPFTTPTDLSEHASKMVCGSQSQISRVVTLATSGTTGSPKRVYFSKSDQEFTIDFFACGMSTLVGAGDKTLILLPGERPGSVGELLLQGLNRINAQPVAYGLASNTANAVQAMCQEQATCLVGIPVQILAMARYWEKWGKSSWSPRCALLSTDYLSTAIVGELKRIWNCEVYDHYGMTEMGLGGGLECSAHAGYHLREADLYFEIIDPASGNLIPDGEYGEVVFTTLSRQGMPLIRYRTGDISRFITEPCPCGSILRRLERIRCRKDGQVYLGNLGKVSMPDFDEILFPLPGVINFSVTVIKGTPIIIKLTIKTLDHKPQTDTSAVLQALHQLPIIQEAESHGHLVLEVKIACDVPLAPGKRSITAFGEDGKNAER